MSLQKVNQTTGELTQIAGLSGGEGGETYYPGPGINISSDNVISSKAVEFAGTQAQWDALSVEEKATYDYINITNDTSQIQYSPGHSISDGTSEKTQREVLEFDGFSVTDDSTNGKTKIAEVPYTAGSLIDITNKEISVDEDKVKATFVGTIAEWEALSSSEKAEYELVNLTDDLAGGAQAVVDAVEEDNYSPVTSNAVYDQLFTNLLPINITADCRQTSSCNMLQVYKLGKILFIYGETVQGAGTSGILFKLPTGMVTRDAGRAPIASGVPQIYGSISWGTRDDTFAFTATADGYTKFNFVVILN